MNIALVTTWFPCGAGYISKAYRNTLEQGGHTVFVYARAGKIMRGDPEWDGERVMWAPGHSAVTGIRTSHFLDWLKLHRIDAVLFNEQRYWKPVIAAKQAGILCICHVDYYKQDWIKAFGIYDVLICNTQRHFSVFQWHSGVCYVPWGVSLEKFAPSAREPGPLRFITSAGWDGAYAKKASYMSRRGTSLALEAFSKLSGDCQFLLYSQVPLSDCPVQWKRLIDQDPRILFHCGTFDPFPYEKGDVYLYPARLDGIGLTLPEALATGLPAITTHAAPMNEFVQNGINGTLVDVANWLGRPDGYYWAESLCDIDALTTAMRSYLDDPSQLDTHRLNALTLARENLNWQKNSADLGKRFEKSLRSRLPLDLESVAVASHIDHVESPTPIRVLARIIRDCLRIGW